MTFLSGGGVLKREREGARERERWIHMGGCQNYGPFLGPYYSTAPNI